MKTSKTQSEYVKASRSSFSRVLASKYFFYGSVAVFFLNSAWLAITVRFGSAFDESYHLGLIQLYSKRFLPFWAEQPPGTATYGALNQDASYLFHYLLSFPYRLIEVFIKSEDLQMLTLRFICMAIFIAGIIVYRKVLKNTGASNSLVNIVLALFLLTPITVFLAAQLNYDNLVFLIVGLVLLLSQKVLNKLRTNTIDFKMLNLLIVSCLLGSLVKYAFLPIFITIFIYVGIKMILQLRKQKSSSKTKKLNYQWRRFIQSTPKLVLIGYALLLVVSFGLFSERYLQNLYNYGTPVPECNQVLNEKECLNYGSWARNYKLRQQNVKGELPPHSRSPVLYAISWSNSMTLQLFYALNGSNGFKTGHPTKYVRLFSLIIMAAGSALFISRQRRIRRNYRLDLAILVTLIYSATLFLHNYSEFLYLGQAVAIQGRYLIPVLPIIYLVIALGFNSYLVDRIKIKLILAYSSIVFLLTQGGAAGVYVLKSDAGWYRPKEYVVKMNSGLRKILSLTVIEK